MCMLRKVFKRILSHLYASRPILEKGYFVIDSQDAAHFARALYLAQSFTVYPFMSNISAIIPNLEP